MLKRFEILILRPLYIILIGAVFWETIFSFTFKPMWLFVGVTLIGIFYLGIIGSKLHPYQSASNLAKGPLKGKAWVREQEILTPEMERLLVGHACTRVGILFGIMSGFILWFIMGWRWYFAIIVAWFINIIVGALLKLIFKTI